MAAGQKFDYECSFERDGETFSFQMIAGATGFKYKVTYIGSNSRWTFTQYDDFIGYQTQESGDHIQVSLSFINRINNQFPTGEIVNGSFFVLPADITTVTDFLDQIITYVDKKNNKEIGIGKVILF